MRPVLLLGLVGLALLAFGALSAAVGLWFSDWLLAQLPPVTIDASAVGGAAFALGVSAAMLGAVHILMALLLARAGNRVAVAGVVLTASMAVLAVAWASAALVSAASGSAPVAQMLPAGIGLLVLAVAYAWATADLVRVRRRS